MTLPDFEKMAEEAGVPKTNYLDWKAQRAHVARHAYSQGLARAADRLEEWGDYGDEMKADILRAEAKALETQEKT